LLNLENFHGLDVQGDDVHLRSTGVRAPSSSTLHCRIPGCPVRRKATAVVGSCSFFNLYLHSPLKWFSHVVIKAAKVVSIFVAAVAYLGLEGRNSYPTAQTFLERDAIFSAV
jgi:hypothetical protein